MYLSFSFQVGSYVFCIFPFTVGSYIPYLGVLLLDVYTAILQEHVFMSTPLSHAVIQQGLSELLCRNPWVQKLCGKDVKTFFL